MLMGVRSVDYFTYTAGTSPKEKLISQKTTPQKKLKGILCRNYESFFSVPQKGKGVC